MLDKNSQYHAPDYILIGSFVTLLVLGLLMLSSAGAASGFQTFNDSYWFLKHQLLNGLLPGIGLFLFFFSINYQFWKKFTMPLLVTSILLLLTVFIPGLQANYGSAHSWINILGISIQPSELVKLTFLLYISIWLEKRGTHGVKDLYYGLLPFLFLIGVISILMILQPDTGSLAIIIVMSLAVFFASGAKFKHLLFILLSGATAIYFLLTQSTYRAARFTTFLHPELDPQGIGYHINQAFLAIGSGGFWGLGFGLSRQKFQYLPEVTGDSIFAIIAEEMGFFVCLIIIGLYLFILYRGLEIAKKAPDQFGRLIAIGIVSWLTFQAFFNIASMVGLVPMTGIPLPFISYGGTAYAVGMGALGLLANISRQTKS